MVFFFILLFAALFFLNLLNQHAKLPSRAVVNEEINTEAIAEESTIINNGNILQIDLYSEDPIGAPLYNIKCPQSHCVFEFLNSFPQIKPDEVEALTEAGSVKGAAVNADQDISQRILPTGIVNSLTLTRTVEDEKTRRRHFYFNQVVGTDRVPLLGADVQVHLVDSKLYSFRANITAAAADSSVIALAMSEAAAEQIALEKARSEAALNPALSGVNLIVCDKKDFIVNKKILGISEDDANYETVAVRICSNNMPAYSKTFYVGTTGIIYEEEDLQDSLNRQIFIGQSSTPARKEGEGPVSNSDVNAAYDIIGDTYNYYMSSHQRDSYDNRGGLIRIYTNLPEANAFWSAGGNFMMLGTRMATRDVIAHEFTHGVTTHTAALRYSNQSGALNEAMSDIFGWALDSDNWTIGEDSALGAIRSIKDPPSRNHPDRLFSPNYYCGSNQNTLVHSNSGVMNKGFYLMVEGGVHNDCIVSGIGKDKSLAIVYRALTTYLRSGSNFRDAYSVFLDACRDLYGAGSGECESVKRALQAVEMDQQTVGSQTSVSCDNRSARKTPECVNPPTIGPTALPTERVTLAPTAMPTALPTKRPTVFPTPVPTDKVNPLKVEKYEEPCEISTLTQSVIPPHRYLSFVCVDGRTGRAGDGSCQAAEKLRQVAVALCTNQIPTEPAPTSYPTSAPAPPKSVTPTLPPSLHTLPLTIDLALQGVYGKNLTVSSIPIQVGLSSADFLNPPSQTVNFTVGADGIFSGQVIFAADPGPYCVLIKGPYHIQKKVCHARPVESYPGSYRGQNNSILLKEAGNELDFTGIVQLVGDLRPQDGVVNAYDIARCRADIGRSDRPGLEEADVNFDGVVNAQDCALLFAALDFKYDEE